MNWRTHPTPETQAILERHPGQMYEVAPISARLTKDQQSEQRALSTIMEQQQQRAPERY